MLWDLSTPIMEQMLFPIFKRLLMTHQVGYFIYVVSLSQPLDSILCKEHIYCVYSSRMESYRDGWVEDFFFSDSPMFGEDGRGSSPYSLKDILCTSA